MLNAEQLNIFKRAVQQANKKRDIARIKYYQHKHDLLFDNGNKVYYACLRFIAFVPTLRLVEKYKTRKYALAAQKKYKESGCHNDYITLSKRISLLPEDSKLKDEYLALITVTINKLKSMEKSK